jgi:hypothetical protein
MAQYGVNFVNPQAIGTASTTAKCKLGQTMVDELGREYIYLQQVTATASGGLMVTFDQGFLATLAANNATGPVAVATGTVATSSYGWYQRKGWDTVTGSAAAADGEGGNLMKVSESGGGKLIVATAADAMTAVTCVIGGAVVSGTGATSTTVFLDNPYTWNETT